MASHGLYGTKYEVLLSDVTIIRTIGVMDCDKVIKLAITGLYVIHNSQHNTAPPPSVLYIIYIKRRQGEGSQIVKQHAYIAGVYRHTLVAGLI